MARIGFDSSVWVLLSCDQESKQRSPAPTSAKALAGRQSPRGLVPWTLRLRSGQAPERSSRARALRREKSPIRPFRRRIKLFRQREPMCPFPVGLTSTPWEVIQRRCQWPPRVRSIPAQALPQGSVTWTTACCHERNSLTSHPPKPRRANPSGRSREINQRA